MTQPAAPDLSGLAPFLPPGTPQLIQSMPPPALHTVPPESALPREGGLPNTLLDILAAGLIGFQNPALAGETVAARRATRAAPRKRKEAIEAENVEIQNTYNKEVNDLIQAGMNRASAERVAEGNAQARQDALVTREEGLTSRLETKEAGLDKRQIEQLQAKAAAQDKAIATREGERQARIKHLEASADLARRKAGEISLNPEEDRVRSLMGSVIQDLHASYAAGGEVALTVKGQQIKGEIPIYSFMRRYLQTAVKGPDKDKIIAEALDDLDRALHRAQDPYSIEKEENTDELPALGD